MKQQFKPKKLLMIVNAMIALTSIACETKKATFSLLAAQETFKQSVVIYKPNKVDILWVVDNSNSMMTSQGHIADNYQSFINRFQTLNYDFHMAITQTDSWKSLFNKPCIHDEDTNCSHLKDGHDDHSGVFVMDSSTPNLTDVFKTNIKLGTVGSGDERAFQSFYATLSDPSNSSFRRQDAFLAIIIISDEDDFSQDTFTDLNPATLTKYSSNPNLHYLDNLHSIQHYVDFLDQYTGSIPNSKIKNYSVSTLTILDEACATQLDLDGFYRYPGLRYQQLADATGGVKGSLCDDFGGTLEVVSNSVIEYASIFKLDRVPVDVNAISVLVDGVQVPLDENIGWTYLTTDNAIQFHGSGIPKADAQISINYDPTTVKL